jgi:glycosyltransferase involved in cell wall biosynthesis
MRTDIVHETYFSDFLNFSSANRRVTTVYDMIHEIYYPNDKTSQQKKASVDRCDHILCISHNTKNDLCEIFRVKPEKVTVTHLACDDFGKAVRADIPPALAAPYFLHVGNRAGHKNFEMLVRAFASVPRLVQDFRIVCFGGGRLSESERRLASDLGLESDALVHIHGDDDLLATAYANATAFVYPSLYEGFGLPPLEAMSAGCPVLSSNRSSLPEVIGNAALLFDPQDKEALADALEKIAESDELRDELIERGRARWQLFSWQRCVRETLDVYRGLL